MEKSEYFRIIYGTIPVLLSAPHVNSHRRPSLTMSYKTGEPYTDRIVEEVCTNTGAYGIVQTKETPFDPNYHKIKDNPYKSAIADLIEKEGITRFVDIHGLSDEHEYDFGIYYPLRFNNSLMLAKNISKEMNKDKLRGLSIFIFSFTDDMQETLGEYVASELKVPSVQLEIARYIRDDEKLRNALISNLSSFILL